MGQTSAWGLSALGQLPVGGTSTARLMGRVTTLPCEAHPPGYERELCDQKDISRNGTVVSEI